MTDQSGEENKEIEASTTEPTPEGSTEEKAKASPVKIMTLVVLAVCFVMFLLYVLSDRHTPYTDQARIKGLSIPIVSNVARIHYRH